MIKEAGYGYIVACKIKAMSEKVLAAMFDESGYTSLKDEDGDTFRYKTLDYVNTFTDENKAKHQLEESLVVSFSAKRALKNRSDWERLIKKAEKLLENPENITTSNKRGGNTIRTPKRRYGNSMRRKSPKMRALTAITASRPVKKNCRPWR